MENKNQLTIIRDISSRHSSHVNTRSTESLWSVPDGQILDDVTSIDNENNNELCETSEQAHYGTPNKENYLKPCIEVQIHNGDDSTKQNIEEERRTPRETMNEPVEPSTQHKNKEEEEFTANSTSGTQLNSSEKDSKDNRYYYEMDEVQFKDNLSSEVHKTIYETQSSKIPVEDMDQDTVCGLGIFKPQWLQKFATAKCYLLFYSIIGILQGSYFTYLIGTLSTIEKRYAFKSKISGTIMMLDEVTPLFLGILVGYFGGRAHRPRIVALGMFMSVLCCLISALPYFMYGTSQHLIASHVKNDTGTEYCDREMNYEQCSVDDRPPTFTAVACLIIGSFFKGFGNLAYITVGMSYMDDNAKKKNTPIYFGIVIALRLLGPILGFIMSSAFLNYYENPFSDPGYGAEDPRWIGAWWLGFVLQAVLLFIFSIPILFFPRRLPKQRLRAFSNTKNFNIETNAERIKGLLTAVKRLLKNPVYISFTFGTIFSIIAFFGYVTMLPKYLENQFRVSASESSLLTGPPCIASSQITTIIGGIVIYKLRPKPKTLIGCHILTEISWLIGCFVLMWPACYNIIMPGVTVTSNGLQLENECNTDCLCSTAAFNPVCGPDGFSNYFSPCHAHCVPNETFIGNCSCVRNKDGDFITSTSVKRGLCKIEDCRKKAIIYVVILTILTGISWSFRVAHTMILLRCIEPQDKSLALGLFETLLCGLAFIPLPIIFGALADASCLIWETSCGEVGNCWVYDVEKLNYLLHGISALFTVFAIICYTTVLIRSKHMKNLYEDDECEFEANPTNSSSNEK